MAKEFVAARDDEQGVLILSRFTGAAVSCVMRLWSIHMTLNAPQRPFAMARDGPEDRAARMQRLRKMVRERNIYRWAGNLIGDLCEVRLKATGDGKAEKGTMTVSS